MAIPGASSGPPRPTTAGLSCSDRDILVSSRGIQRGVFTGATRVLTTWRNGAVRDAGGAGVATWRARPDSPSDVRKNGTAF